MTELHTATLTCTAYLWVYHPWAYYRVNYPYPPSPSQLLPPLPTNQNSLPAGTENEKKRATRYQRRWPAEGAGKAKSKMAKHHPDLIMCRKQPGVGKCQYN